MKRLIYFLTVCFFTLILIQGSPLSSSATINTEVQTLSEEMKSEGELMKINIRYPIIKGGVKEKIDKEVNDKFKNDAFNFKNDIEKQAREGYEIAKKQGYDFIPYVAYEDFKVTFNRNNIVSIPVTFYYYTGGAHGGSYIQPNNIDLLTGKFLTLGEFFKDEINYKPLLVEKITAVIKSNPNDYFPDAIQTIQKLNENQPFYLTNDSIILYYGEYEIAPYAGGIKEFRIPFSSLKNTVRERFIK